MRKYTWKNVMNTENQQTRLKLDRSVPFVNAVFQIIEGSGTETEAARILGEAERAHDVKFLSGSPDETIKEIPANKYTELVEPKIRGLLSTTHLVIGSAEYGRLHIVIAERHTYNWTHREWANMLADWANQIRWLGVENWKYLDFYGGPNDRLIENYNDWCATAMNVIHTKSIG